MTRLAWAYCTALKTCRKSSRRAGTERWLLVAMRGQWRPGDVLESEVGQARGINPRVVEARDARVLETCEDVALTHKPLLEVLAHPGQQRQLQSHLALERPVRTPREPNLCHTPGP